MLNNNKRRDCEKAYSLDATDGDFDDLLDALEKVLGPAERLALGTWRTKALEYNTLWEAYIDAEGKITGLEEELEEAQSADTERER